MLQGGAYFGKMEQIHKKASLVNSLILKKRRILK